MHTVHIVHTPGHEIGCKVTAPVKAGQLLMLSGPIEGNLPQVAPATADAVVFGIASQNAVAGAVITVHRSGIFTTRAGAAIAPGDKFYSDAEGRAVKTGSKNSAGIALSSAAKAGDEISVAI